MYFLVIPIMEYSNTANIKYFNIEKKMFNSYFT